MSKAIYQSLNALEPVKKVLADAASAIKDKSRSIKTSEIPEVIGAVVGGAAGVGIGVAAVSAVGVSGLSAVGITSGLATLGALIGGGMVAGIFVAGAPMALLGVGGFALLDLRNKHLLREAKDTLLKEAMVKHDAIIQELHGKVKLGGERAEYLNALNILLREIIANLEKDLAK